MPSLTGNLKDDAYGAPDALGVTYMADAAWLADLPLDGYFVIAVVVADQFIQRRTLGDLMTRTGSRKQL